MSRFEDCLGYILRFEGGYSNHPADRGGATNKGITQGTFDAYNEGLGRDTKSVESITDSEVQAIYLERFWNPCRCGDLHNPLDLVVFDSAVQHGVSRAAKWLQREVGVATDGVIGNATLFAVNQEALKHGLAELVERYMWVREEFYAAIIARDPSQEVFANGWKNRMLELEKAIAKTPKITGV